jgi:hypothetical protein
MLKRDFADANKVDLNKPNSRLPRITRFMSEAAKLFSPVL